MLSALLALLLAAQQPAAPAAPSADDIGRAYFEFLRARTLETNNDVSGALASYREAIALMPDSAALRVELATLHTRLNQMPAAEREARAALAIEPDNREAHLLLGGIQATAIEAQPVNATDPALLSSAIDHLERGLRGAVDEEVSLLLGALYLRRGDIDRAIERFALVPEGRYQPAALRFTAKAHELAGRSDQAAAALARLRTVPPDNLERYALETDSIERAGLWAEAANRWSQIVAADPSATIYRTRQAAALAASGRLDDARSVLRVATREMPKSVRAWYLTALIEGQAKNIEAVDAAVAEIRAIDPNDGRAQVALARARAVAGNPRGVIEVLERRVERPHASDISSGLIVEMAGMLSGAYENLDQPGRAVRALETARRHAPENQQLMFALASAYEENRRYDRAERTFRELIAANDAHAPALNYLGYMLAERGRKLEEALSFIERALAIDENNPAYLDSLGWAYFRLGRFDEAREPLERAAKALPNVSVINDHLGDLYLQLKRYDDAVAAFERALAGDRDDLDAANVERKRDRARQLAGKS